MRFGTRYRCILATAQQGNQPSTLGAADKQKQMEIVAGGQYYLSIYLKAT